MTKVQNTSVSAATQVENKKVKKQQQKKEQQVFKGNGNKQTVKKPNDSALKQEIYKKTGFQLKDTANRGKIIPLKVNGKVREYETVGTLTTGGRILVKERGKEVYHVVSHTKDNKLIMLKDDYAKNKIFYESTSSEHKVKYGKKNYVITNSKRDRHGRMSAIDENGKRVVLSSDGKELKTGYVEAEDQKDNMNDYIAKQTKGKSKEEAAKIRQQILSGNLSYSNKGVLRFKASNGEVWYYDTKRKTYVKYAEKEAQAIIKNLDKGATENWGLFRTGLGTDYELLKNTNAQIIDPEVLGKVNKHYSAEYGNKVDKNAQYGSGKYKTAYEAFLASEIGDDEVYQFNAALVKNNAITDQSRRNEILQTNLTKVGSRANRLAAADAASRKEDYQTLQDAAEEENKKKNYKAQFKGQDALQTYIYGVHDGDVQEIDDFNTTLIDPKEDMLDRDEIVKIKAETGALWAKQGKYDKAFEAQDGEIVDKMFALQDANGKASLNVKELKAKAKGFQGEYLMFAKPELFTEQELADKAVSMLNIALSNLSEYESVSPYVDDSQMAQNKAHNLSQIQKSISKAYTLIRNDKVLKLVKQKMGDKFNLLQKKEQEKFGTDTFADITVKNESVKSNLSAEQVAQNKYVVSWLKSQLEDLERDKKLNEQKEGWKQSLVNNVRTEFRLGETKASLANKYDLIKSNMSRLEAAAEGKLVDKNGKPVSFEDAMKNLGETGIQALEQANADYQTAQQTGEFMVDMAVLALPLPKGFNAANTVIKMGNALYKVISKSDKVCKVIKITQEAIKGSKIYEVATKVATTNPKLVENTRKVATIMDSSATGAMHMAGKTFALEASNIATSREGFTADRNSEMNTKTQSAAVFGGMGGAIGGTTAVASEYVSSAGAKYAVHTLGLVADVAGAAGLMTAESHGETNFWDNLRCVNPDGSFNFEQASMTAMMIFGHLHGMSAIKGKPMPKAEIQADGTVKYTLNNNELKLNKDGIYTDSETGREFRLATNKNSKTELVELTKKEIYNSRQKTEVKDGMTLEDFRQELKNNDLRGDVYTKADGGKLVTVKHSRNKYELFEFDNNNNMISKKSVVGKSAINESYPEFANAESSGTMGSTSGYLGANMLGSKGNKFNDVKNLLDNFNNKELDTVNKKQLDNFRKNVLGIKQTQNGSNFKYSSDKNTIIITEMLGKKEVAKYEIMSDENGKPFIRKPDEYGRGDDATFYSLMTEKKLSEILKEFDIKPTQEGSVFHEGYNGRSIEIYEIKGKEFLYSYRLELDTKGKPHIVERKPIDLNQKTTQESQKPAETDSASQSELDSESNQQVAGEGSEVSEGAKQSVEIPKKLSDVNSFVEEYPDFVKSEADGVVTITNKKANLTIEYDKNTGKKVVATQVDQDGLVVRNTFNEDGSIATRESDFVYEGNRYHEFYDVNKGTKSYQQILDKNTGISTEVKPELAKKFAEGTVDEGKFTPKEEVAENTGESNTPKTIITIEEAKKLAKQYDNVEVTEYDNGSYEIKVTDENGDSKTMLVKNGNDILPLKSYDEIVEIDSEGNATINEFNKNDLITKKTVYDSNGNVEFSREFEYDNAGNKTKVTHKNAEGNIIKYNEYEYNENNKRTKEIDRNADGSPIESSEYEYSDAGNVIKRTDALYSEGKVTSSTEYEYNDGNVVKSTKSEYEKGELVGITESEYKDGNLTKETWVSADGNKTKITKNEYKDGTLIKSREELKTNQITEITEKEYNDGKVVKDRITNKNGINEGEYNKDNKLIKETIKDVNGKTTQIRKFEYNNKGVKTKETRTQYKDDNIVKTTEYEIDDRGYTTKETQKDADGNITQVTEKEYSKINSTPTKETKTQFKDGKPTEITETEYEDLKPTKEINKDADGKVTKIYDHKLQRDLTPEEIKEYLSNKDNNIQTPDGNPAVENNGDAIQSKNRFTDNNMSSEKIVADETPINELNNSELESKINALSKEIHIANQKNARKTASDLKKIRSNAKNMATERGFKFDNQGKIVERPQEKVDVSPADQSATGKTADEAKQIYKEEMNNVEPTSTAQVKNLEKYDIMFQSKEGKALLDKAKQGPNFGKTVEERVPSDKIVKDADGNIQSIEIDGVTYTRNEQGEYVNEKGDSKIQIEAPDQDTFIIDPKIDKRITMDRENNKIIKINSDDMTIEYDSNGQPEKVSSLGNTIYLSTGNSSQNFGSATVDPTGRVIRNEVSIDIEGRRYEPYFSEGNRYSDWNKDTNGQAITLELRQKTRRDLSKQIEDAQLENKGLSTTKKGRQKAYDDLRNQIEDAYNNNKISREDADNLHAELNEKAKANGLETQETPTMKAEREALAKWNEQVDALKNNLMSEIEKVDSQASHDQMVEEIGEACKNGEIDMKRANELYDALEAKANSIDGVESLAQKAERINAELKAHENKSADEASNIHNEAESGAITGDETPVTTEESASAGESTPVGENSETADAKPSKISMFDKLFHRNKARLEKEVANGEEKIGDYKFNTVKDENGYVRTKTDNKNVVRQKEYFNAKGKKIKTETFDTNKNLIELTEGNVTTEYYADGDVKRVKYPNNKTVEFIYENGELTGAEYTEEISKAREFARSITAEENEFGEYEYDTIKRHTKYKYNSDPDKPHFELVDKNDNVVTDKNGKPVGTATFDSETRHWVEEGQYSSDLAPKTTNVSRGEGRFRIKLPERNKVPKNLRDENGKLREGVKPFNDGYTETISKGGVEITKGYDSKGMLLLEVSKEKATYYNAKGEVIAEEKPTPNGTQRTEFSKDYDLDVLFNSHGEGEKITINYHKDNKGNIAKPEEFIYDKENKVYKSKDKDKDGKAVKTLDYDAKNHSWTIKDAKGYKLDSQNNMKESHIKRNIGIGAGVLAVGLGAYGISKLVKSDDDKEVKQFDNPAIAEQVAKTIAEQAANAKAKTKVTLDGKEGTIAEDGTLTLDGKPYPKAEDGTYTIGDKKYKVEDGKLVEVVDTPDDNGETGGADGTDGTAEVKGTVDGKEYTIHSDGSATIGGHQYEKESDGYYHTEDGSIYGIGEDGKLVKIDKTQAGSDGSQAGSAGSATQAGSDGSQAGSAGSATQTGSDSAQAGSAGATSQQTGNTNTTGNNTHVTAPAQPADSSASTRTTGTTHNDTSVTTRHTNVPAEESRVNSSRPSEQSAESRHTGNTSVTGATEPTEEQKQVAKTLQDEISSIANAEDALGFTQKIYIAVSKGQITPQQAEDLSAKVETYVKTFDNVSQGLDEQNHTPEPEFGLGEVTTPQEPQPKEKQEITSMERMELTKKIKDAKTKEEIVAIQQKMRKYKVFPGRKNLRRAYKAKLRAIKHQDEPQKVGKYNKKFEKRMDKIENSKVYKNDEEQIYIDDIIKRPNIFDDGTFNA